jgi:hypothetical protein
MSQEVERIQELYQILQKFTGLHRQLLELIRAEREALVSADLKSIQEMTYAKEAVLQLIAQQEQIRLAKAAEIAKIWKQSPSDLTLKKMIIEIQGRDTKLADQLRSAFNTLTLLVQRALDQNSENKKLVEASLQHISAMKENVLGEIAPSANTYTPTGQKAQGRAGSRLISKEG